MAETRTGTFSRRQLLALSGVIAVAGTACSRGGSGDASSGESEETGAISFAWWGNDARADVTRQAIEAFEASRPGTSVAGEYGGFDGYFDKLATQTSGGSAPDVFQMNEWNLREYADRGALADLNEYGMSFDAWSEGANAGAEVDGRAWGATAGINLQAVVVDPVFFEDVGVDIPDDRTWTWEHFHELAAELTAKSADGAFGAGYHGSDQITAAYFFHQVGSELFGASGVAVDPDAVAQWYQLWLDMILDGTSPSASMVLENGAAEPAQSLFGQGRLAMSLTPANLLVDNENLLGRELRLLRIPTMTGQAADLGMWYRPSLLFCVAATSKDPETATALVDFLLNSKEAGRIMLAERGVPPNTEVLADITPELSSPNQRVVEYMESCAPDLTTPPLSPPAGAGSYPGLLGRYGEDVIFEKTTPAQAAEDFVNELSGMVQ
ncbi:ABC transporter substrate-binding protein [Pseudactinotalea suaedae]|uniref:ABC transporter substrate-binding protein n=1 Tax=Pseudactinotalea suaedae TaxID=1524924 RepID=UPI001391A617|nr:extracellular solute-binding protein [Pseudactinotalea suaedae]